MFKEQKISAVFRPCCRSESHVCWQSRCVFLRNRMNLQLQFSLLRCVAISSDLGLRNLGNIAMIERFNPKVLTLIYQEIELFKSLRFKITHVFISILRSRFLSKETALEHWFSTGGWGPKSGSRVVFRRSQVCVCKKQCGRTPMRYGSSKKTNIHLFMILH